MSMSDLDKALAEIQSIRSQVARTVEFRGYGPSTLALTGVFAALAAVAQSAWIRSPTTDFGLYLALWVGAAILSVVVVGIETVARSQRVHSGLAQEMIQAAVEQFLPAGIAGALLTAAVSRFAPESLWMLPALWQIVFALGVFASGRFLPRAMLLVGGWYLASGAASMGLARGEHALSPWAMGAPFCIGQLLMAAIIQLTHGGRK
jgi:hypothetical protein